MLYLKYAFKDWQYNEIYTKEFGYITINDCIRMFVTEGMIPFITIHGYKFYYNKEHLENTIASALYYYTDNYNYIISLSKNISFNDEYYYHFEEVINDEKWDDFWGYWNKRFNNLFFYLEGGFCIQLQHLIYASLDIGNSLAHIKYMEENIDSEEDTKKKDIDPYILEQRNRENHYKFTKFES